MYPTRIAGAIAFEKVPIYTDRTRLIHPLERRDRFSLIPEFTVIVILDQIPSGQLPRPG